jgi:hypothetical protein
MLANKENAQPFMKLGVSYFRGIGRGEVTSPSAIRAGKPRPYQWISDGTRLDTERMFMYSLHN